MSIFNTVLKCVPNSDKLAVRYISALDYYVCSTESMFIKMYLDPELTVFVTTHKCGTIKDNFTLSDYNNYLKPNRFKGIGY